MPDFPICPRCRTQCRAAGIPIGRRWHCGTCQSFFTVQEDPAEASTRLGPSAVPAVGKGEGSDTLLMARVEAAAVPGQGQPIVELLGATTGDGKYTVEAEIARGGMGMILKAVDRGMRRPVAMKVMLGEADERKRARFIEEAQVTGQLEHPNIVPIHELGLDVDGRLFFTMKLVKGSSLEQILAAMRKGGEGAMSLGSLLNAFVNVCNAVAFAHSRNVLHRDLKPANIMLGDYGEVLVMDWGLAKILGSSGDVAEAGTGPGRMAGAGDVPEAEGERIISSFRGDSPDEKTQDGMVIGTPVYMPPEQAKGDISQLDQRSDIYSLGAILYEILTLSPPIAGETIQVRLRKVVDGDIERPERRAPGRLIPREISAIAMKALAVDPDARYPTVGELRRDIELFIEGRAVSAKHDSAWETLIKLVRRNKAASLVAGLAMAVLLLVSSGSAWINYRSALVAIEQRDRAETAQAERQALTRREAPKYLEEAQRHILTHRFEDALHSLETAISFAPDLAAARLLRAELFLAMKDWPASRKDLQLYLEQQPEDGYARRLQALVPPVEAGRMPGPVLMRLWDELEGHGQFILADKLGRSQARDLSRYRRRIEESLPGAGDSLTLDPDGRLTFSRAGLRDLGAIKGLPIAHLLVPEGQFVTLGPVEGMPLETLDISGNTGIVDLIHLKGMRLTDLNIRNCRRVRDGSPLAGARLTTLMAAGTALESLAFLKGMPLTELNVNGCTAIHDASPLIGMKIEVLGLGSTAIADITCVKDMPLHHLDLGLCTRIVDGTPLAGKPLRRLSLRETMVESIAFVKGMPLDNLDLNGCRRVADLSPLASMKLNKLDVAGTLVDDVACLRGMPLTSLFVHNCPVGDLTPLEGMELEQITFSARKSMKGVEGLRRMRSLMKIGVEWKQILPASEFWRRYDAGEFSR